MASQFTENGKPKTVLVDVDETICFYSGTSREYPLAEPHAGNIAKINKMYDEGWVVIYWTARGARSGIDWTEFAKEQLTSWGCKFHSVLVGGQYKPHFDLLIDDKSKRIEEI